MFRYFETVAVILKFQNNIDMELKPLPRLDTRNTTTSCGKIMVSSSY